jgi:hypothetical protein
MKAAGDYRSRQRRTGLPRLPHGRFLAGALAFLVVWALAPAFAAAGPVEYLKTFGPDGAEESSFEEAGSVAVDQTTGSVYVLDPDAGSLFKFDAEGNPVDFEGSAPYIVGNALTDLDVRGGVNSEGLSQVAVNSSTRDIYVTGLHAVLAFHDDGEPAEFTGASGEHIGAQPNELSGFGDLWGVAVDVNGIIYASDHTGQITLFSSTGEQVTQFATTDPSNLAVSSTGALYVNYRTGEFENTKPVLKFEPSAFPVAPLTTYTPEAEPVSPSGNWSVTVDQANDQVYIPQLYPFDLKFGQVTVYDQGGTVVEVIGAPGSDSDFGARANAVGVKGASGKVYVSVSDISGAPSRIMIYGPQVIFEGKPTIEPRAAIEVTANSAILRGSINPNTSATSYYFEYGLENCSLASCAKVPIDGREAGDDHQLVNVEEAVSGLQAGETYYFRIVAKNSFGETQGPIRTFRTQDVGGGFALSDGRVWEMVSPSDKHGGSVRGSEQGLIQAASDGNGLVYLSLGAVVPDPEGSRAVEYSSVLARRSDAGWQSEDITPANSRDQKWAVGQMGEYKLFNLDLSRALLEPRDGRQLSPQASERTPYLRENSDPPVYLPLVTGKEGFANVPVGTKFGADDDRSIGSVGVVGSSGDLGHVLLSSEVPLVEPGPDGVASKLYLWSGGQLQPVSVLPDSEGGGMVALASPGSETGTVSHAVSDDGSRVFWSRGNYGVDGGNLSGLYVRDMVAEETVRLDVPDSGASGVGTANPVYQGASIDGKVVFFTDSQQLTVGASGRDLYRCEINSGDVVDGCDTLTNLTAQLEDSGESAEVVGLSPGVSENGERIYFVAKGSLDSVPNGAGEAAVSGQPNMYVWKQGDGVRYVATLAEDDSTDWGGARFRTQDLTAASSPGGQYLAFMSNRNLTGYDNRGSATGVPVQEVFQYDANADQLRCVSCNPTNAAPVSNIDGLELARLPLVDPRNLLQGRATSAVLPQSSVIELDGITLYRPRAVLDNGRVFFNSIDSLVPADSNGEWDVYQFEPDGLGGCEGASGGPASAPSFGGCVSLVSSGTGEREAGFLDASASGDDVFFLAPARLSAADEDEELDVYDARVDGIAATLPVRSDCQGDTCQPQARVPENPTPGSATVNGPGNVRATGRRCPKDKHKVHHGRSARCIARKHHKKPRHHQKAGKDRRSAR